nr:transporter substrate-binding domain-containing protein [Roseibium sp. CAU 1639]
MVKGIGVAAFLLFAVACARAGPVKLVTFEYPPYEYWNGTQADGIVVRIVTEAFGKLGRSVSIQVLPWKRALHLVKTGEADAIFTAFKTDEREQFLDYSTVVLMPQVVSVWTRKDAEIGFNGSMESLAWTDIGLVEGISYGPVVDAAIKARQLKSLDYVPESSSNIRQLLGGRVDAVIMNRYGAMHHLNQLNALPDVVELQPEISSVPSYIAYSKKGGSAELRDAIDDVLQRMIASGEYKAIIDAYFRE